MNLQFILVPIGILLLAIPTSVLCGARMRARLDRPVRRYSEGLQPLLRSWANWLDLVRGAGGAWLIQYALHDTISAGDEMASTFLGIELGIFFICVLAQTIWFHRPIRIVGPFFFLAGVSLVLSGPLTGTFALAVGLSCAMMIGRLSSVFWFVSVGLLGFGFVFKEFDLSTAFNAFIFLVPAMLAFRFGTRMAFMRRPHLNRAQLRAERKARAAQAKVQAVKKAMPKTEPVAEAPKAASVKIEPRRLRAPRAVPLRPEVKIESARSDFARAESAGKMGTVIENDFAAKPTKAAVLEAPPAPVPTPAPLRRAASARGPLPDFLRIAEGSKPARGKIRIRVRRQA